MESCIYLFDKQWKLSYEKKEHIIPAGIGGKCTLPQGYVSDQANELFSKYELQCLRYSPLLIERARYGPGKRGSRSVNSIDTPDVLSLQPLIEGDDQNYLCPLGFVFRDCVYILPQMILVFDEQLKNFDKLYLRSTYQTKGNIESLTIKSQD